MTEYALYLYFRQGDDLRAYLDENNGNVSDALADMAYVLYKNADACLKLSREMRNKHIMAHAEGAHISFEPIDDEAKEALNRLEKEKIINIYELEEEEYGDEYDDDGEEEDDEPD